MLLLNSDTKVPSNPTLISTTHMFALAPMMPTIFLNFLETATPHNKPFSVTALKLQAMLFHLDLNELKKISQTNTINIHFLLCPETLL